MDPHNPCTPVGQSWVANQRLRACLLCATAASNRTREKGQGHTLVLSMWLLWTEVQNRQIKQICPHVTFQCEVWLELCFQHKFLIIQRCKKAQNVREFLNIVIVHNCRYLLLPVPMQKTFSSSFLATTMLAITSFPLCLSSALCVHLTGFGPCKINVSAFSI